MLYSSSRARDRELSRAQVGCKRLGWRAALSRSWQRRNEHRQRLAATSAVAVSNPFQALEASEENVQSRAFLSREWPSGPRDDGAEAREFLARSWPLGPPMPKDKAAQHPREASVRSRPLGPAKPKSKAVRLSRQFIHHRIKVGSFNLNKGMHSKVGELE